MIHLGGAAGYPLNIGEVQIVRKAVLAAGVAVGLLFFAVTNSYSPSGSNAHELIEWVGIVLIVICIIGRTWTSLYISGRKITELVEVGPYSVTRNPLYAFSILGAVGFGAQQGSILTAVTFGVLAWLAFNVVASREEHLLAELHGAAYADYQARVPRFLPNPRLWRDVPTLTVIPSRVAATAADAMIFLLAVPVAETFEWLQGIGVLPVLLLLP